MIAGTALLDDFTPPTGHDPNHHQEARQQRPKLPLFDPEQAFHIGHAANRECQQRHGANQRPW